MSDTINLAMELLARKSVTPADDGCQQLIATRLQKLGFSIEHMRFGDVDNLWARRGKASPLLVFAGHTDVVPTGPAEQWTVPPFAPEIRDGFLYGRGAADMKGSIAAMVTACERFFAKHPQTPGSVAFLLTSDEEGPAVNGTVKVIDRLNSRSEKIDWCIVGEPTSTSKVGDVIKIGRRGSLTGRMKVRGIQGHVAYPHLADNPVHRCAPALAELCSTTWDHGNESFPPTTFQISNIHAGTGADNVIPGAVDIVFNFRYSTELTHEKIQERVAALFARHGVDYEINWEHSGGPFLTRQGDLITALATAIRDVAGYDTETSTSGGTSDGRFIAPTGAQVVELGPLNATIHKINERVGIADLETLSLIYERSMEKLLMGL